MAEDLSVSLALVTLGRPDITCRCLRNVLGAGVVSQVSWVDNGSDEADRNAIAECLFDFSIPVASVFCETNSGAAHGYNLAYSGCSGGAILATDGDFWFPPNALDDMRSVLRASDRRVCVSMYHYEQEAVPERFTGPEFGETLPSGRSVKLRPAMPMVPRMFKRCVLDIAGWVHEGLGKSQWDEVEWSMRVLDRCAKLGLESLCVTSDFSHHLPDEMSEPPLYCADKLREWNNAEKRRVLSAQASMGYPPFIPEWCAK